MSHAEFAAELTSLPSGLLAMVYEAIVKLNFKVLLGPTSTGVHARSSSRTCRLHGPWERADEVQTRAQRPSV